VENWIAISALRGIDLLTRERKNLREGRPMLRLFILCATIATWPLAVLAKGDIEYGEYLSTTCVTCHQLSGTDNGIPSIVGWDTESFVKTLQSYQAKERDNPVMQMITEPMTTEEMEALAAYFATIKPVEVPE